MTCRCREDYINMKRRTTVDNVDRFVTGTASMLHLAARSGCVMCVRWLINEKNANINIVDGWYEDTPLLDAILFNKIDVAKELMRLGANINVVNKMGKTAVSCAINNENRTITRLLIKNGATVSAPYLDWVKHIIGSEYCRHICRIFIGIRKKRTSVLNTNVRDITQIIAKMIWSLHMDTSWYYCWERVW